MAYFPLQGQYDMDIHQLTDIFCQIDDFCNTLDTYTPDYMLDDTPEKSNTRLRFILVNAVMCASGLRKAPMVDIPVCYRGSSFFTPEAQKQQILAAARKEVQNFNQFLSTSTSARIAEDFAGEAFYTLRNLRGLYIEPISGAKGEREFLIPPTLIQLTGYESRMTEDLPECPAHKLHCFEGVLASDLGEANRFSAKQLIERSDSLRFADPEAVVSLINQEEISPERGVLCFPNNKDVVLAAYQKKPKTLAGASTAVMEDIVTDHYKVTPEVITHALPTVIIALMNKQVIPPLDAVKAWPANRAIIKAAYKLDTASIKQALPIMIIALMNKPIRPEDAVKAFPNNETVIKAAYNADKTCIKHAFSTVIVTSIGDPIKAVDAVEAFPDDEAIIAAAYSINEFSISKALPAVILALMNNPINPLRIINAFPNNESVVRAVYEQDKTLIRFASPAVIVTLISDDTLSPLEAAKAFRYNKTVLKAAYEKAPQLPEEERAQLFDIIKSELPELGKVIENRGPSSLGTQGLFAYNNTRNTVSTHLSSEDSSSTTPPKKPGVG